MSEEKKFSLEEIEGLMENNSDDGRGGLNFQTIFAMLVLNWQWFLLSLVIFVCGAFIYLRYTEPVYKVSARILIKDKTKNKKPNEMLANVEDLGFLTNSTGIDNEIEILRSRILLRDVVKDLKIYTEYRSEGRVINPIIYQTQPVNVDLDPVHLDSLDYNLLEKTQWVKMRMTREDTTYILQGSIMNGKKEEQSFTQKINSLPGVFKTSLGTITLTANANRKWEEGAVYLVTIRPPMAVASGYLNNLSVSPTSKLTSIAELTLNDKNYRRAIDVLSQINIFKKV